MPDPSFVLPLFLQSALIPFGVALAVLVALHIVRGAGAPDAGFIAAFAPAAGFLASYFAVFHQQWSFEPHQALDWLPWIVLLGGAGALAAERASHAGIRVAARCTISLAAAWVVISPAAASMGWPKAIASIAATGFLLAATWSFLARASHNRPTPPLLLMVIAGGAALALMFDSSQAIGQLSGALASAIAASIAFNIPRQRVAFGSAATGLAVLVLGSLLANAHFYSGFPLGYVAMLAGAVLADPLVATINLLRRRDGGFVSHAGAALLSTIPVVATIALAVKAAQESGAY